MYESMTVFEVPMGILDLPGERPVQPHGCHWFRCCEECHWETCVVDATEPDRYESTRGRQLRGMGYTGLLVHGISADRVAAFFGVSTDLVLEETRPYQRMLEAIERRRLGDQVSAIASAMHVTERLVMYWCQGVPGISRSRRSTSASRSGTARGMLGLEVASLQERADYVRALFE